MTTNIALPAAEAARYPNFDLLRLLLAFNIVFSHMWYLVDHPFTWNMVIFPVPAFLAISGFLVLKSYAESGSWLSFAKKRALRVLPALGVSMLLCLILFRWHGLYCAFITWITGGLVDVDGINNPLWSLAWEELAYLCLALLWLAGAYRRVIFIWVLLAASLYVVYLMRDLSPRTQMISFLLPAFFTGNLMYLYREILLKVHPLVPWITLIVMLLSDRIPFLGRIFTLSPILFSVFPIVWVGMAGARLIPFKFPDISYGLYIYHMPLIVWLMWHKYVTSWLDVAIILPLPLLAICLASWYWVEKPALKLKQKFAHAQPAPL